MKALFLFIVTASLTATITNFAMDQQQHLLRLEIRLARLQRELQQTKRMNAIVRQTNEMLRKPEPQVKRQR